MRASTAVAVFGIAVAALAGCVAAPLMDGFLVSPYERVPAHVAPDETASPDETESPGDTAPPAPTEAPDGAGEPDPIATSMPTEAPDGA